MAFIRDVESNSVSLRLRKPYMDADITSHTVLTDDVFSYVDFFFKTHKKVIKKKTGERVKQNHTFYWEQARQFYCASKMLSIESAPLPMYYCMLNAAKAYLFYYADDYDEIEEDFGNHGLNEDKTKSKDVQTLDLANIFIARKSKGVFPKFGKAVNSNFDSLWKIKATGAKSIKELLFQIPYVHSTYSSTYKIPRKNEAFIPLAANQSPRFMYNKSNKIKLVVNLDQHYFKQSATAIPDDILSAVPSQLMVNDEMPFQLVSKEFLRKKELKSVYNDLRRCFSYISADRRIWYLRKTSEDMFSEICPMIIELAIVHRFSEIVRYKPEQMAELMHTKENWLIHEFLSLVLDQFMDEIACEITKQEIMPTRVK